MALSPEAAGRIYLAMVNGNGHFSVLHNLARFEEPPGMRSRAGGHLVAFEGEVRDDYGLPRLLQFDEADDELFALDSFSPPDIRAAALFYFPGGKNDRRFLNKITSSPPGGKRYSRLIPIPTEWGPYFLDQPNFGTTFRQLVKLMHEEDRKDLLWHCAASLIYVCGSPDSKARRPVSTMSSKWRRVAYSQSTRHWATAQWEGHAATKEADARQKDPPAPVANGFDQVFGRAGRQPGVLPKRPHVQTSAPAKQQASQSSVAPGRRDRVGNGGQSGGRPATGHAAAAHNLPPTPLEANIDIFTALLKAQSDAQIVINDANHQNFIAFIRSRTQDVIYGA